MEKDSNDIKEILKDMNSKISHIEDIEADNRKLIVKVIKQGNAIVQFLRDLEIEPYEDLYDNQSETVKLQIGADNDTDIDFEKHKKLTDMLHQYMDNYEGLKEFEEELKKHKSKITPGQVGEA